MSTGAHIIYSPTVFRGIMRMSSPEPAVKHVGGAACLTRRLGVYQLPAFAVLIGGSGSQGRFEVGGVLRPQTNGASSPTGGLIARPRLIGGRVGATVARAQLWAGPGWRISSVGVCGDVLEQTRLDMSATRTVYPSRDAYIDRAASLRRGGLVAKPARCVVSR